MMSADSVGKAARISEQRSQELLKARGINNTRNNSNKKQGVAKINYHCSWQNNLAMTEGKTRVLVQVLMSRLDAGEQVSEAAPTTNQTHREGRRQEDRQHGLKL